MRLKSPPAKRKFLAIIPTIEPASDNNTPAPGDGEEIENPDIDLNNLFKNKKGP